MDEETLIGSMIVDDFTPLTHALERLEEQNSDGKTDEERG